MYHSGILSDQDMAWIRAGKKNKYGSRQLYLADGLRHVEGSLHQLQGGVLQVGSSETAINIIGT